MNDRFLGYCIIIIILCLILIPTGYAFRQYFTIGEIRTVEFYNINSVSFLSVQDPVRLRGVQVGTVYKIENFENKTIVQIKLEKPISIYEGYIVTAYLKGLMGERYVSIYSGNSNSKIIPSKSILHGEFLIGPTEIVAYAGQLKLLISKLNTVVSNLKDGTPTKKSLIQKFAYFSQKTDTLTSTMCSISINLDKALSKNRDTIQQIITQALTITDTLSTEIPGMISEVEKAVSLTTQFAQKIDTFIDRADSAVAVINNPESVLWKDDIKHLQKDLQIMRKVLIDLNENGLELPIRFR